MTSRQYNPHLDIIAPDEQPWRANLLQGMQLVVEIGSGAGLHPIRRAMQNPNEFVIAIERTAEKFANILFMMMQ